MDAQTIQNVIGGLILAAVLWMARTMNVYGNQLTQLKTILTGANGENGINGEVKGLRERTHTLGDAIHSLHGRQDLLAQRVDTIEERRV